MRNLYGDLGGFASILASVSFTTRRKPIVVGIAQLGRCPRLRLLQAFRLQNLASTLKGSHNLSLGQRPGYAPVGSSRNWFVKRAKRFRAYWGDPTPGKGQ